MKVLLWLALILLVAVAAVWPGFAAGLAELVVITAMFLLAGVVHLLSQPPLLALAAVALGALRLARPGAGR